MNVENILVSLSMTLVNYIFVTTISNSNQKAIVSDNKTDLRMTKDDIMAQLKEQHIADTGAYNDIVSQVKECEQSMTEQHSMMMEFIKQNVNQQGGGKNG